MLWARPRGFACTPRSCPAARCPDTGRSMSRASALVSWPTIRFQHQLTDHPQRNPGIRRGGPFSFRPGVSEHALTPSCEQGGVLTPFHARKPLAGADRPGRPAEPVSPRSCPRKRRQPSPAHLLQTEIFRRFFPDISAAVSKGQSKEREPVGGSSGGSPSFSWSAETGSCGDALGSKKQRPVPAAARPARASAPPPPPLPSRAPKSHYHIPLQCGPTFLEQSEISR